MVFICCLCIASAITCTLLNIAICCMYTAADDDKATLKPMSTQIDLVCITEREETGSSSKVRFAAFSAKLHLELRMLLKTICKPANQHAALYSTEIHLHFAHCTDLVLL